MAELRLPTPDERQRCNVQIPSLWMASLGWEQHWVEVARGVGAHLNLMGFVLASTAALLQPAWSQPQRELVSFTGEQLEAARMLFRGKVGPTVQFGAFKARRMDSGTVTTCSKVNARNGYGGMTGMRPFSAVLIHESRVAGAIVDMQDGRTDIAGLCRNVGLGIDVLTGSNRD